MTTRIVIILIGLLLGSIYLNKVLYDTNITIVSQQETLVETINEKDRFINSLKELNKSYIESERKISDKIVELVEAQATYRCFDEEVQKQIDEIRDFSIGLGSSNDQRDKESTGVGEPAKAVTPNSGSIDAPIHPDLGRMSIRAFNL